MPRSTWGGFVFKVNVSRGVVLSPICTGGCTNSFGRPRGSVQVRNLKLSFSQEEKPAAESYSSTRAEPWKPQSHGIAAQVRWDLPDPPGMGKGWRHRICDSSVSPADPGPLSDSEPDKTLNKQLRGCPRRWELCYNQACKNRAINSGGNAGFFPF